MRISEITEADVAGFLRLEDGDYDSGQVAAIMPAAEAYISSYTGIPAIAEEGETLDDHEDLWLAYMALCQDMYDNRSFAVEKDKVNPVVDAILGMHTRNLL